MVQRATTGMEWNPALVHKNRSLTVVAHSNLICQTEPEAKFGFVTGFGTIQLIDAEL
jgi:hypothetical protein